MKQNNHQSKATFTTTDGKEILLNQRDHEAISAMLQIDSKFKDVIVELCMTAMRDQQKKAAAKAGA